MHYAINVATKYLIDISKELKENPNPEKSGGWLTRIVNSQGIGGREVLSVGEYPQEKNLKYNNLSQEKAHRLLAHYFRDGNKAFSSYQTRNPEENMWGGAVLKDSSVSFEAISFSGLAEKVDEALSLTLIQYINSKWDENFAKKVMEVSENLVYEPMMKEFRKKFEIQ